LNPTAESLLGLHPGVPRGASRWARSFVATTIQTTDPPGSGRACAWSRNQVLRLPEKWRLINRAGREYAVRASAAPIRDQRGRVLGAVVRSATSPKRAGWKPNRWRTRHTTMR